MQRKYQLLVYGASGFTGRLCAKYLHENYPDLSWAIGGRNKKKLEQLKKEMNLKCDILIADAENYEDLAKMVKETKVLLTTAGPYAKYGSLLLKACIFEKTHYTDITGENHWVKGLIDKEQLLKLAKPLMKSGYGKYLIGLCK